ncbi:MAG: sulfatase-like hydrolase/transferase [Bryobacteraceae bacterium]
MLRRKFLSMAAAARAARPNFVFVLVDDLRFDELGCTGHPFAETPHADRLAREGTSFTNAFATTPLCSPSRGSFLTGQYPHTHGITDNVDRSAQSHRLATWPRLLHDAGYRTGFVGKWHMGNDDSRRPGFDHWVSFPGQGESIDPVLNVNGRTARARGYVTDVLTDHCVDFLEARGDAPFCLYLAHKAIHPNIQQANDGSITGSGGRAEDFIVADRHRRLYEGRTPPRRGNYAKPPHGKPALEQKIAGVAPLSASTVTDDATILNRMRMTKAIDEGLGRMLAALEKAGKLDETVVAFTSDHGYFYGEHCLGPERRLAYEETIRIPMLVRYPRRFRAGARRRDLALSIDVAPTMLGLAGVAAPRMEGASFMRPAKREEFLIEYYSDTVFPRIRKMGYQAVRTRRWKYIHYRELDGADELYDLERDPWELENLAAAGGPRLAEMQRRLARLSGRA